MDLLFGFSGRIGRLQWWLGQLAILVLLIVGAGVVFGIAGINEAAAGSATEALSNAGWSAVLVILALIALTVWINIAVTVKRFHDRNKSGLWFLITFVPYVGWLWVIVECGFLAGSQGANDYGSGGSSMSRYDLSDFDVGIKIDEPTTKRSRPEATKAPTPATASVPQVKRAAPQGFGRRGV